tara:strand:+ start:172 stop:564 length:393 start_codon:yes stop_codon:yes gene_type:complete
MKNSFLGLLLLLFSNALFAQDFQSKTTLEKEIIGRWYLEQSPEDKYVFSSDGSMKHFIGDSLIKTTKYRIVKTCNEEERPENEFFLKETDENAYVNCYYIDAVNYDHNGLMTLMTQSRGNILVFKKEESK